MLVGDAWGLLYSCRIMPAKLDVFELPDSLLYLNEGKKKKFLWQKLNPETELMLSFFACWARSLLSVSQFPQEMRNNDSCPISWGQVRASKHLPGTGWLQGAQLGTGHCCCLGLELPLHSACTQSDWVTQLNGTVSSSFLPDPTLTAGFISTAVFAVLGSHWISHFSPLFPFPSTSLEDPDGQLSPWILTSCGCSRTSTVHFLSLVDDVLFHKSAKMLGVIIELHVKKSKQIQGSVAVLSSIWRRVYKYSVETHCTLCSEKLVQKLNIQRCSWLPSWEWQCHSAVQSASSGPILSQHLRAP